MKERLVTLLCALGALVLFLAMFLRAEGGLDPRREVPRPTTEERRGNGYYAAMSWLEEEDIRTVSLRERFSELPERTDIPSRGNVLIVTLPATTGFDTAEFRPLDRWIREGNTLLILAALSDSPDWAVALGGLAPSDLNLLTGLEFETVRTRDARRRQLSQTPGRAAANRSRAQAVEPDDAALGAIDGEGNLSSEPTFRAYAEPRRLTLKPNRPHAYFNGVDSAVALSDYPSLAWTVRVPYEGFVLSLAHQEETGEGVLWTRPLGNGRIIVSGFGTLFTNHALGLHDNARLMANIVGVNLGPEGAVLFDDLHQGLGATYDPNKFYSDPRLYMTIGILFALWLVWVLGSTRLRLPVTYVPPPRESSLVRATGEFFARVLRADAGARRLFEHFFRRIRERAQLRHEAGAPWEILERHPRIAADDLEQLKRWYADAQRSRRVPLVPLYNLMVRIDRQIA